MIHLPGFTNATTTAVLAPASGLVAATSVPNLVYESTLTGTPVFSTHLPIMGYSPYRLPTVLPSLAFSDDCSCHLKQRVKCQIAKAEAAEALAKVDDECSECCVVRSNCQGCQCCCLVPTVTQLVTVPHVVRTDHAHQHDHHHDFHHYHHDRKSRAEKTEEVHVKEEKHQEASQKQNTLKLDEKIRRIRHELNLPNEKELSEMCREMERKSKIDYHEHCAQTETKKVVVRARSRSKSAERSKSRSRSANINDRPPWRPTGGNVYTRPHTELVLNRNVEKKETVECQPQPAPCREYVYYVEPTRLPREAYYTVCEPAKTTIKTTVNTSTNNNAVTTGCNNNYYQTRSKNWCQVANKAPTTVTKYDCVPTSTSYSYLPSIHKNTTYETRPYSGSNAYYTTSSKEPATVYYC